MILSSKNQQQSPCAFKGGQGKWQTWELAMTNLTQIKVISIHQHWANAIFDDRQLNYLPKGVIC